MDDLDRPPLGAYAYEQIEAALYEVDKIYWQQLQPFQVFALPSILLIMSRSGPAPPGIPKRPLQLIAILKAYARALFHTEFVEYPTDQRLPHWIRTLAQRTGDRVMRIVAELETSSLMAKLDYHGVTASQMRESIDEVLRETLERHMQELVLDRPAPALLLNDRTSRKPPEPVPAQAGHLLTMDDETERRKRLLAEYKAATNASNKRIYEARNSGVHKPQFYQWLNGQLSAESATTKNIERFLMAKKPPIRREPRH